MTDTNTNELFGQALSLQQQKLWDEALLAYKKITDLGPDALTSAQASVAFHNMALVAGEKSEFAMAYIWSKKAVSLQPENKQIQATYEHFQTQFQKPQIPRQLSSTDQIKNLIVSVPVDFTFALTTLILLVTLSILIKKMALKIKAKATGIFEKISWWPVYVLTFGSLALLGLSAVTLELASTPKGIIRVEKAQIQIVPGENKAIIFEAPLGLEVEILSATESYLQIRYAGAFTGWVLKTNIESLSLKIQQ